MFRLAKPPKEIKEELDKLLDEWTSIEEKTIQNLKIT